MTTQTTIRLRRISDTLDKYVFGDDKHAKEWLSQEIISECIDKIFLERGVKTKETCKECGHETDGFNVKQVLSVQEFLAEKQHGRRAN